MGLYLCSGTSKPTQCPRAIFTPSFFSAVSAIGSTWVKCSRHIHSCNWLMLMSGCYTWIRDLVNWWWWCQISAWRMIYWVIGCNVGQENREFHAMLVKPGIHHLISRQAMTLLKTLHFKNDTHCHAFVFLIDRIWFPCSMFWCITNYYAVGLTIVKN